MKLNSRSNLFKSPSETDPNTNSIFFMHVVTPGTNRCSSDGRAGRVLNRMPHPLIISIISRRTCAQLQPMGTSHTPLTSSTSSSDEPTPRSSTGRKKKLEDSTFQRVHFYYSNEIKCILCVTNSPTNTGEHLRDRCSRQHSPLVGQRKRRGGGSEPPPLTYLQQLLKQMCNKNSGTNSFIDMLFRGNDKKITGEARAMEVKRASNRGKRAYETWEPGLMPGLLITLAGDVEKNPGPPLLIFIRLR